VSNMRIRTDGRCIGVALAALVVRIVPFIGLNLSQTNAQNGRGERIRTSGLYVPNVALYLAKLHPDKTHSPMKKRHSIAVNITSGAPTNWRPIVAKRRCKDCLEVAARHRLHVALRHRHWPLLLSKRPCQE
jgi:hypothetical protein